MNQQDDATPPDTPDGTPDTTSGPASRPPAKSSQPQQGSAMDGELAAIRNKIKRLEGKSELNGKQWKTLFALMREEFSIVNPGWRDGAEEFLDHLKDQT